MNESTVTERLYNLLPAIYRRQDFFQGEPLRALLAIVEQELGVLEADINNLYENWFIETCDMWVMPYIAELVGISDLKDPEKIFPIQRSRIGNTMRYRRHKGTPRTLELVIEDTTGWTVRVVEMFKYVLTSQYIQRPRIEEMASFTLRSDDGTQSTEVLATRDFFDTNAHTLDIRAFDVNHIRYNLKSLSLFIWRLESYPVKRSTPYYRQQLPIRTAHLANWQNSEYEYKHAVFGFDTAPSQRKHTPVITPRPIVSQRDCYYKSRINRTDRYCQPALYLTGCYTFHPLGYDMPLFNRPQTRENIWEHKLDSRELPMAIGHEAFQEDLRPFQTDPPPEREWDERFIKIFQFSDRLLEQRYPNDWLRYDDTQNKTFSLAETDKEYRQSVSLELVPDPQVERQPVELNSDYYYGPDRSLAIYIRICKGKKGKQVCEFQPVPPVNIEAKKLTNWESPSAGKIAVDVEQGLLMFAPGEDPGWDNVQVNYSYGFSGNMGGGPYNRGKTLANYTDNVRWVARNIPEDDPQWYTELADAIADWQKSKEDHGIIRIMDNKAYFGGRQADMPVVPEPIRIKLRACDRLTIEAGNGYNPSISPLGGDIIVIGSEEEATLRLNGLLCGGRIVVSGNVRLEVDHCTIKPKRESDQKQDSIVGVAEKSYNMKVQITNSIVGKVELPADSQELVVQDSIIDGEPGYEKEAIAYGEGSYGPIAKIERSTIFGRVYSKEMLLGSETIFNSPAMVREEENGGLRYSYAPVGYKKIGGGYEYYQMPERYECQPKMSLRLAGVEGSVSSASGVEPSFKGASVVEPSFTSRQYAQPGYAQLSLAGPKEIASGAGNGGEMGAFNNLKRPQRDANLEDSLEEYLRFGLEVNKVYKN
ncbi:MAG: hypothetical protein GDA56_26690 [Hormoscilla sp. GM7CHS1pb]|nr:hypothetical protein [Hormoscilla sp. GM7CHS1pb]